MKKRFSMENLDCANCAAKMEAAIRRIDGVDGAVVSFMAQKLTIEADPVVHTKGFISSQRSFHCGVLCPAMAGNLCPFIAEP